MYKDVCIQIFCIKIISIEYHILFFSMNEILKCYITRKTYEVRHLLLIHQMYTASFVFYSKTACFPSAFIIEWTNFSPLKLFIYLQNAKGKAIRFSRVEYIHYIHTKGFDKTYYIGTTCSCTRY